MIEVKYYYMNKSGTWMYAYAYFHKPEKALRFMYKLKSAKKMFYAGEFSCDNQYDTEYITRRFK